MPITDYLKGSNNFNYRGISFYSFSSEDKNIPNFNDNFSRVGQGVKPKDFAFIRVLGKENKELDVINFQFMPKSITDQKSAQYQDINIIGRSSPFKSYSSSGPRGITFTLEFMTNPEAEDNSMGPSVIRKYLDRLQALVYPIYENYTVSPPPHCLIHIGDQLEMVGVCNNVSVNYDNQRIPWTGLTRGGIWAFGASVNLSFYETAIIPIGYNQRKQGQDRANVLGGSEEEGDEPEELFDKKMPSFFDINDLPGGDESKEFWQSFANNQVPYSPDGPFLPPEENIYPPNLSPGGGVFLP